MGKFPRPRLVLLFALAFLFAGCEKEDPPKPAAPSGTFTYGGEGDEIGSAIYAKPGGGYMIVGGVEDESEDWDVLLIEVDADGQQISEKVLGNDDRNEVVRSLKPRAGGGFVLAGFVQDRDREAIKAILMLVDNDWNLERELIFIVPTSQSYYLNIVSYAEAFEMPSGGWLFYSAQGNSMAVTRLLDDGEVAAQRTITNTYSGIMLPARRLVQASSDSVYDFSTTYDYTNMAATMSLLDDLGSPANTFELDVDTIFNTSLYSPYQYSSASSASRANGNLLANICYSGQEQFVFEVDPQTGVISWLHRFQIADDLLLMQEAADGSIRLAGNTAPTPYYYGVVGNSNITIASLDSVGGSLRRRSYGGDQSETASGMTLGSDGKTAVIGSTQSYGAGNSDIFLILYQ